MSPNRPDVNHRSKLTHDLRAPHLRSLRKELLIVRADVERMELAQSAAELRNAVTHFSWLKFIVPGFASASRWGKRRGGGGFSAANIGALLKQYPLVSSIASMVLAKPLRQTVVAGAKPVLKWGSLALGAWEAWRIWQQMKDERQSKQ